MDKEKEIWKILQKYGMNPMLTPNCGEEILALFSVSNCDHPRSERTYIGQNMLRCNKCGKEFS